MMTHGFLAQTWEMLIGRTDGPLTMRLILQPTMAAIFAIRSGLKDAREGRPPYFFWLLAAGPARRPKLLGEMRKDVGKVFILALVLDVIYEWMVYRSVYPVQALITATVLAILPYLLVRGPVTRIVSRFRGP
jgi:hypothetical protein